MQQLWDLYSMVTSHSYQIASQSQLQLGEEFVARVFAAARTYKRRETAKSLIPLGTTYTEFKYSIERKRVLNAARVVTKEDNVKQHSHTHKIL